MRHLNLSPRLLYTCMNYILFGLVLLFEYFMWIATLHPIRLKIATLLPRRSIASDNRPFAGAFRPLHRLLHQSLLSQV